MIIRKISLFPKITSCKQRNHMLGLYSTPLAVLAKFIKLISQTAKIANEYIFTLFTNCTCEKILWKALTLSKIPTLFVVC